ncbi:ChaB family protein, partial [Patescibacteria group bacterium]|nr:ChaB family protein [Patescibacteria group bacterium]
MPYSTIGELPDGVKKLPKHGQEIYQKAFNAAFEQYKDRNNREALAHATAWSAVERAYEKVDGRWVSKTKEATMALSDTNKRQLLQSALLTEYKLNEENPIPSGVAIEEVFDDKVIYMVNGQSYSADYTMDESGKIIGFSDPKKVLAQKTYKTMESLQSTYSEIIQEAGRRNASLDSARIKKIVELCQELLSSEAEPEEDKTKEAIREAKDTLKWLRLQEAMKTEDGQQYPATAFAYAPDVDTPSKWKLRLWEDPVKKVTRAQLGRAAAALSPGGFRGQKVAIPTADLSAVKRKIRAEYRRLGVEDEDIP